MKPALISFDCYGTLIDWERGLTGFFQPLLQAKGIQASGSDVLAAYSEMEPLQQSSPYRLYREVLRGVVFAFGQRFGFQPSSDEADGLAESLKTWEPFPDTVPALRRLARNHRLAILSNIDRDLFAATARRLEVPFDLVITAEEVRSYKPARPHFETLLARSGLATAAHLHAAESLYHDIAPARALWIPCVWVRRSAQPGQATASRQAETEPDATVADLTALADWLDPR